MFTLSPSCPRFVQGASSDAPYVFYHWQYIDIFNYFSHNMVTIPPAVWTNAAHRHGVLVLGETLTQTLVTDDALGVRQLRRVDITQL